MKNTPSLDSTGRFLIILVVSIVVELFSSYRDKTGDTLITLVTVLIIWYILKRTRFRLPGALYNLVVLFTFMSMYLGKVWGFYHVFYYWDKILHFSSGIILGIIGYLIYYIMLPEEHREKRNPVLGVMFSVFFSISMAGVWEIFEFTTDCIFGLTSQNNSLTDTMGDIIAGTTGASLISFKIYMFEKGKRFVFLQSLITEVNSGIREEKRVDFRGEPDIEALDIRRKESTASKSVINQTPN